MDGSSLCAIPNVAVESHQAEINVPVQWWRSVGHSHTAFAVECFVDELAGLAQKDPYQFRRVVTEAASTSRRALISPRRKRDGTSLCPKAWGAGSLCTLLFGSYAAQVAEVSVSEGRVRVHRMVCAIDGDGSMCPDPGIIAAQAEGGAIFGASAALFQELTFENGRLQQTNFNTLPP